MAGGMLVQSGSEGAGGHAQSHASCGGSGGAHQVLAEHDVQQRGVTHGMMCSGRVRGHAHVQQGCDRVGEGSCTCAAGL